MIERLLQSAARHLPPGAEVHGSRLSQRRWEVGAALPWGWTLPQSVVAARLVADEFQAQGVYLAFDVFPTLGAGFRAVFEQV